MILILDNYDSFTFNLVHYVEKITREELKVFRNDEISLDDVDKYAKIILSPGPGLPAEAGILMPLIKRYAASKKILGVCLGHQAIGEVFGAKLYNLPKVFHGVSRTVKITDKNELIFKNIPSEFNAGRYHSWVIDKSTLPSCLRVTSSDSDGEIMSVSHVTYDLKGVQFHPESILTDYGEEIIKNWLE